MNTTFLNQITENLNSKTITIYYRFLKRDSWTTGDFRKSSKMPKTSVIVPPSNCQGIVFMTLYSDRENYRRRYIEVNQRIFLRKCSRLVSLSWYLFRWRNLWEGVMLDFFRGSHLYHQTFLGHIVALIDRQWFAKASQVD